MKQIPQTRKDFERNMYLLVEKIQKGEHHILESQADGLMKVRELPNKRIDFLTVNETARLMANHLASMMEMDFSEFIKDQHEH